jgi:hypothetical protein
MPIVGAGRRSRLPLLSLLLAVLLIGSGVQAVFGQELAELEAIMAETAEIRELPPLSSLDPVFMTQAEAEAAIADLLRAEWDEEGARAAVRSAAALGLLPPDTDLFQLNLDLLGEQVGGYYDPETARIVVIQDEEFGALGTYIFSHEITHALQDEHLGLGDLMEASEEASDDQLLAAASLYEGDATLASVMYLTTKPLLAVQVAAQSVTGDGVETAVLDTAPPIMSLGLLFPYIAGPAFVQELHNEGGWAMVDEAYADPPTSTEQILHVDKYFDGDEPVELTLPDPAETLGEGWERIDDNVLGEFQTSILLANLEPGQGVNQMMGTFDLPDEATAAAEGWDGDRYEFWVKGDEAEAFVWRSVWESEAEASEFFAAFRAYDEGRFGESFTGGDDDLTLETDGPVVRLVRVGDAVFYAQAPGVAEADQIIDAMIAADEEALAA